MMEVEKLLTKTKNSNFYIFLAIIATIIIVATFYDTYFGKGDFFGLSKKNKSTVKEKENVPLKLQ